MSGSARVTFPRGHEGQGATQAQVHPGAQHMLDDGDLFTPALTAEVRRVQAVYTAEGKPGAPKYVPGVVNVEFKYDVGLLPRPPSCGRSSSPSRATCRTCGPGPCASNASVLEQQGVCKWQPVNYDCAALPFNNQSGCRRTVPPVGATSTAGRDTVPGRSRGASSGSARAAWS
jgi:hypothetical protein